MFKAILQFLFPREMIYLVVLKSDGHVLAAFYSSKKAYRFIRDVDCARAIDMRVVEVYITP